MTSTAQARYGKVTGTRGQVISKIQVFSLIIVVLAAVFDPSTTFGQGFIRKQASVVIYMHITSPCIVIWLAILR